MAGVKPAGYRLPAMLLAGLLCAATGVACTGSNASQPRPSHPISSHPISSHPRASQPGTSQPGAGDTAKNPPVMARCVTPGLLLSAVPPAGGGAMGHQGLVLVFRNTTRSSCALSGYPGVAARDSSGRHPVDAARSTVGSIFPRTARSRIVLAPGGTVSAGLEWTVVPMGPRDRCPRYAGLAVTPPDETRSLWLTRPLSFCGEFRIHPLVSGTDAGGIAQ